MLLASLRTRDRIIEQMDNPLLDPTEHRRALAGLRRLNAISDSVGVLWPPIAKLARELNRPLRVLDVATGSGDVPRSLAARACRASIALEVSACDISPTAIAEASRGSSSVQFFTHDVLHTPLPTGFDAVTCSLFLHHLSEEEAAALLANMQSATRHLILINDLARSRFNYCAVWLASHLLSRSPVVRFDGPASVRNAFTPREALALATCAGLEGATAQPRFPCRFLLSWRRV